MNITHVYIHKFTQLFLMSISDKNPKLRSRDPCIQASSRAYHSVRLDPSMQEIEIRAVSYSPFVRSMPPKFGQIVTPEHHIEISRTTYPGVLATIPQCAQSFQDAGGRSPSHAPFMVHENHVFEVWSKITHDVTPPYSTPGPIGRPGPIHTPVASVSTCPGQDPMPVRFISQ